MYDILVNFFARVHTQVAIVCNSCMSKKKQTQPHNGSNKGTS